MTVTTTTTSAPSTTSSGSSETSATPQTTSTTTTKVEITTYFPEITTEPSTEPTPVFKPEPENDNSEKQNEPEIHDNSSGVRKILDGTVTLPPSKMSVSPSSGENISAVLPVIQALPPPVPSTEIPGLDFQTVANFDPGDIPGELGGNLKVSGNKLTLIFCATSFKIYF